MVQSGGFTGPSPVHGISRRRTTHTTKGLTMHRRRFGLVGFSICLAFIATPTAAFAQATCAQLNTNPALGLAGDPTIIQHTTTLVPPAGSNPAYCRVDFVVSERGGPANGYAIGEVQRVVLRVGLPANTADG